MANKNDITYEIIERIGVIQEYPTGWRKEINKIAWNGGAPKYDIRDWDSNHERMSRGITLSQREMDQLRNLMNAHDRRTDLMPRDPYGRNMER